MSKAARRSFTAFYAACAAAALFLGLSYPLRVSDPRGFYKVSVKEELRAFAGLRRPRRTVVVVFDGLGLAGAAQMRSLQALRQRGRCFRTEVGPISMSRPVYAELSTGLEPDRGGARGNDDTAPLQAESIWQLARAAGLTVTAVSELPWWRQLFPQGFTSYRVRGHRDNLFRLAADGDLMLIHPVYVDAAGHAAGAGSARYRIAVARADRELHEFVSGLDLSRDLLLVTADHGHSLRGGHGGAQAQVAQVLSCYAGAGIAPAPDLGVLRATTLAPALAVALGLRFPAQMRAGDDDLDTLWQLFDPAAFPRGYLAARRQAVERFRQENRAQLARWLGAGAAPTWTALYELHRKEQERGVRAALLAALAVLAVVLGFHARPGAALFGFGWVLSTLALAGALQVLLRGSFDATAMNDRLRFVGFVLFLGAALGAGPGRSTCGCGVARRACSSISPA